MSIPINGEPVRFNYITASAGASSASLNLFYPGTSTVRVLQPYEIFTLVSLNVTNNNGDMVSILNAGPSTGTATSTNLLIFGQADFWEWHDDGAYSLTGSPGIVPSVLTTTSDAVDVAGTGVINNAAPALGRNPQYALLTPGGNF